MNSIRFLFFISVVLLLANSSAGQVVGYYRFPTIHGDFVVFSAEGDLWKVSTAGGTAMRLTVHDGNEAFARFSPDGRWIAFSGEYQGNLDVYVMPSEGGEPRRLTFHPGRDEVVAWKPDSSAVVFRSRRASPNGDYRLFEVLCKGGHPAMVDIGLAALASYSPDGKFIAFNRFSREFRTWKRYHGGWAQDVWVGDLDGGAFGPITIWQGTDRFPMWHNGRIYFLSDRTGRLNIHSCDPNGSDMKRLTDHEQYDARWPDMHAGRIVYMYAGDLWILDTSSGSANKLEITLPTDRIRHRPRFEDASRTLEDYILSPDGKKVILSSRGELWVCPAKKGRIVQLTRSTKFRERSPAVSPEGDEIACITDETGEQELAVFDLEGKEPHRLLTKRGKGWIFQPVWSPDGKKIAYADLTMSLFLVDVESKEIAKVDHSPSREIRQYAFSPDGKWLAYAKAEENEFSSIYLYGLAEGKSYPLTPSFSDEENPAWDPEGKYLFFISRRSFNPIIGEMDLQHLVVQTAKPYALILARDGKSPFLPDELLEEKKEEGAEKDEDKDKDKEQDKDKKKKLPDVKIDIEGIQQRVVEFPVPADNYAGLAAVKGKVFYISYPTRGLMEGSLYDEDTSSSKVLHVFDLKKKKADDFLSKVRDYTLSRDGKKIAFRTGKEILVASTAVKPGGMPGKSPDKGDQEKVDPSELPLEVKPAEEWAQIFHEAWRLQRDFYWAENLANVDWDSMREKYGALLPRISTRDELNDLIGQLIGELCTSHTYIFGGDIKRSKRVGVGLLGADLAFEKETGLHRFIRVLRPEVWETDIKAPLTMTHAGVKEGDYLFAVNGGDLKPEDNINAALANLAGKQVLLTVGSKPDRSDARDVQIETLRSEARLRYRDWCRRNREYVDEKSGGRIGYFHMPDMMGSGLVEFIKGFYPQVKKDGLIIDVRYNGGGFVSQMLIERLKREVLGYDKPRRGQSSTYPSRVHAGYKVCLINQQSGSDGDIFPENFKNAGLGPLIGMRTWGGVVGMQADKRFIDGGISTQPEFAWWRAEDGWDLENRGVIPDIELDILPQDYIAGRDPQLDRGIAEIEALLEAKPLKRPEPPPYPDKSVPGVK